MSSKKQKPALIAAGSVLGGLFAAGTLAALGGATAQEHTTLAALLFGFAFGWALLAGLSKRFTSRPQRWAAVPAVAMAGTAAGLVVLAPDAAALSALGWAWPSLLLALVVWMTRQSRRQQPSRSARLLLYPVFAVLALAAVGGAYETVSDAADAVADDGAHRLVDVGDHRLDIRCIGSGSPTVVLEPGLGETAAAMARWIAPDVARTTRVCSYDRAGHGRSDAAPKDRADAARDLRVLLQRSGIAGPYVIAGHSLGGAYALSFAHRYPAQVAGLVLIDSMHPHQNNAFATMQPLLGLVPVLARTGLARLLFDANDGSPIAQARRLVLDIAGMPAELNRAAALRSLGDRPLGVVTAGRDYEPGWLAHQDDLAVLSRNSEHRTIAGSTHESLVADEGDAAHSAKAIRDVVAAVRLRRAHASDDGGSR